MTPSSDFIIARLLLPGNLASPFPVMICVMSCRQTFQFASRVSATLLFLGASINGSVHAGELAGHPLPAGVAVSVDDATGRNRVTVQVGADVLAVNSRGAPVSDHPPRYRLATDALGGTLADAAIELWPESRARDEASTGHTAVVFSSGFTLAASNREVVLFDLGRCATAGDAAVWLPKERTLITGRVTSASRVGATPDTDLTSWINALERLRGLDPTVVIPGSGAPGDADLLSRQIDRLNAIRKEVEDALLAGRSPTTIAENSTLGWLAAWYEQDSHAANAAVQALIAEVGGLRMPWELSERRRLREGSSPTNGDPGWIPPRKVLWRNYWPERLPLLALVAPGVEIVPFDSNEEAVAQVKDADAVIGTATPELLAAGSKLRWVQVGSAGVERYLSIPKLASGEVIFTNGQKLASPEIAEHVMALTRALARGLGYAVTAQNRGTWIRSEIGDLAPLQRLRGKTMLVVGLGGIGTEVARLASAAEMRVTGIRSSRRSGPPFVDQVGLTEDLAAFAAIADVVVNCLPMTPATTDIFDAALFKVMKPTALFVNVGRGGTVDTDALIAALSKGEIAGAGLDVTDPEPLPDGHPLWKAPNLIITPHYAAWSDIGRERRWLLYRENLRRFVAGEPMLSVVDPERGY
jgi:phosphoglycerate dehydrogenase-like enzyme/glyoxylase-like metal-dependent hydrolase (beta-lactamase superfamily II)